MKRDTSEDFTHGKDVQVLVGDCVESMRSLPNNSVHCCITSPPYFALRDYGTASWEGGDKDCTHAVGRATRGGDSAGNIGNKGSYTDGGDEAIKNGEACPHCGAIRVDEQIGLEATPEKYVENLVEVFREVKRVLRDDGTVWLNLGDSYSGAGGRSTSDKGLQNINDGRMDGYMVKASSNSKSIGLKPKDLIGIPWRVAFALQADGWWLRQDIIWEKPNPMPESVTDRCTKNHEYIFLLTKNKRYYYDSHAISEKSVYGKDLGILRTLDENDNPYADQARGRKPDKPRKELTKSKTTRNKRSVWTVNTKPYKGAHFATFPEKLIEPCVLAGTSAKGCCADCGQPYERVIEKIGGVSTSALERGFIWKEMEGHWEANYNTIGCRHTVGGAIIKTVNWEKSCSCKSDTIPCTVLDPFAGSGTTAGVAVKHERKAIMCELNPEYAATIPKRIEDISGLSDTQQTLLDW